jgi:GTP-binding protein
MYGLPIVALVGRPNVGKSTLFNRLVGRPQAIIEDEPGTTRDRNYGTAVWNDKAFLVVDTGGIDFATESDMARAIRHQAEMAIEEADVIVMMVDARSGLTAMDHDVADQLRKSKQPVILAASKADSETRRLDSAEFYALGLGEPIAISGLNGLNTGDMLDLVAEHLPRVEEPEPDDTPRITLVGRPNVGKSSLLNAILQEDRALVSSIPGTTRDTTDTAVTHNGRPVILVDTAGIRKRGHIDGGVERYSVMRAMRAISRSDVAVLVIDATEPIAAQDAHIAGYAWEAGKGLVVVVNKWDLVVPKDDSTLDQFSRRIRSELHFVRDVPLLFTSALTRQRVRRILDLALEVKDKRVQRIATGSLNNVIQSALQRHQPMSHSGKILKLRYVTQVKTDPPTFVFFVNDPELVHFSYRRFLENQLRENFGFAGTALRLIFRSSREAPALDPAGTRSGISRARVVAPGARKPVTRTGATGQRGEPRGGARSSTSKNGRSLPRK